MPTAILPLHEVFFIGRGIDYAISLEGSLKLKEISYIHSEAYAAGELKHGTISLIEEGTLVAAVLTQKELYKKMISNMVEVSTRGAFVLAVTNEGNDEVERTADYVSTFQRQISILQTPLLLFLCSYLHITFRWEEDVMWINREIWQSQ